MDSDCSEHLTLCRRLLVFHRIHRRSFITRLAVCSVRRRHRTRHAYARQARPRFSSHPLRCLRHADCHCATHGHEFGVSLRASLDSRSRHHSLSHRPHYHRQHPALRCALPHRRFGRSVSWRVFRHLPQSRREPASDWFHPDSTSMTQDQTTATANHALQRTAPRVTVAAVLAWTRPVRSWRCPTSVASFCAPPSQLPRHAPPSLSLGSLAVATRVLEPK